ncbi:hypothetical protein PISMIDRAFT_690855, partial [Pisolithus microcarpus 441]
LGTVLYDENAPPEKKECVIHTAASTTILSTGVRLTGFQVYANAHPLPKLTSKKKYGKTIIPEHLPRNVAVLSLPLPGFPLLHASLHPGCINRIPGSRCRSCA